MIGGDCVKQFEINGNLWKIKFVKSTSKYLIDRTSTLRVATTDPSLNTIFLSDRISGNFLKKVLIHEMTHVVLWEYDIISRIQKYCYPQFAIAMEEEICNILADYGEIVFQNAYLILGENAMRIVPYELERLVA